MWTFSAFHLKYVSNSMVVFFQQRSLFTFHTIIFYSLYIENDKNVKKKRNLISSRFWCNFLHYVLMMIKSIMEHDKTIITHLYFQVCGSPAARAPRTGRGCPSRWSRSIFCPGSLTWQRMNIRERWMLCGGN